MNYDYDGNGKMMEINRQNIAKKNRPFTLEMGLNNEKLTVTRGFTIHFQNISKGLGHFGLLLISI